MPLTPLPLHHFPSRRRGLSAAAASRACYEGRVSWHCISRSVSRGHAPLCRARAAMSGSSRMESNVTARRFRFGRAAA
eukprot:5885-Eustigmatos_ZCMA.PRE.1